MTTNEIEQEDKSITETGYTDLLKQQCFYNILNKYSHLLRPAIYPDDTRTVFLLTMCKLIDRSNSILQKKSTKNKTSNNNNNNYNDDDDHDDNDDDDDNDNGNNNIGKWNLQALWDNDRKGLFEDNRSAAVPGPLSQNERLDRLEKIILDATLNPYF